MLYVKEMNKTILLIIVSVFLSLPLFTVAQGCQIFTILQ